MKKLLLIPILVLILGFVLISSYKFYTEYNLVKYKCRADDGDSAIFSVKETFVIRSLFNYPLEVKLIAAEDYFGINDLAILHQAYDDNPDYCQYIPDSREIYLEDIPIPAPEILN